MSEERNRVLVVGAAEIPHGDLRALENLDTARRGVPGVFAELAAGT
jgi:hypothetical protein